MILSRPHPRWDALMSNAASAQMAYGICDEFDRAQYHALDRLLKDMEARGMIRPSGPGVAAGRESASVVCVEVENDTIQLDDADKEIRGKR